jgi:glycine/D-amino acid oxidase-like deaminating enzyme
MSRYLVSHISDIDKRLVPLMVDSSQWHTMPVEDQRLLAKTIAHSFRHFGATIGWLEGHEEEFLRARLKADVFRIVFDGFDEYILRNRGAVQPLKVLDALASLANATGTRIVITSRTSFWNTPQRAAVWSGKYAIRAAAVELCSLRRRLMAPTTSPCLQIASAD